MLWSLRHRTYLLHRKIASIKFVVVFIYHTGTKVIWNYLKINDALCEGHVCPWPGISAHIAGLIQHLIWGTFTELVGGFHFWLHYNQTKILNTLHWDTRFWLHAKRKTKIFIGAKNVSNKSCRAKWSTFHAECLFFRGTSDFQVIKTTILLSSRISTTDGMTLIKCYTGGVVPLSVHMSVCYLASAHKPLIFNSIMETLRKLLGNSNFQPYCSIIHFTFSYIP